MPEAYYFTLDIGSFPSLMGLPHTVHFVLSKNWGCPHLLSPHFIVKGLPQASHFHIPTNVWALQNGHAVIRVLPQEEHAASPRWMVLRQFGH
jgi:hypothetical protein